MQEERNSALDFWALFMQLAMVFISSSVGIAFAFWDGIFWKQKNRVFINGQKKSLQYHGNLLGFVVRVGVKNFKNLMYRYWKQWLIYFTANLSWWWWFWSPSLAGVHCMFSHDWLKTLFISCSKIVMLLHVAAVATNSVAVEVEAVSQ